MSAAEQAAYTAPTQAAYFGRAAHAVPDWAAIDTDVPDDPFVIDLKEKVGASLVKDDIDEPMLDHGNTPAASKSIKQTTTAADYPELTAADPPTDTDGDGIPDQWEEDNGMDKHDPKDAGADHDGDGHSRLEEYLNDLTIQ